MKIDNIVFKTTPPLPYLLPLAQHHPLAVETYILLWQKKDKKNKVFIQKMDLKSEFLMPKQRFTNSLRDIVKEGLANVEETKSQYIVELVDWQEEMN